MKKIYTCFTCGFPFAMDETECPEYCPSCNAPRSQYLEEPWNGSIEARRIHVDKPKPDPNRDKYDISYHHPKQFPDHSRHGRIRRFVLMYDDPKQTRDFYSDVFDWDIISTEHADPERPLMYCATGPGSPNWEPSVPSFGYGFLKDRSTDDTGLAPAFVIEVDSIDDIVAKLPEYGGSLLKDGFEVEGNKYAIIRDPEGNAFYIWETPDTVTWDEPESQTARY